MAGRSFRDDLVEINKRVFRLLWSMGYARTGNNLSSKSPRIVFPGLRNKTDRISEQEARFAYCSVLEKSPYFYSVEVPTEEPSAISNQRSMSGRHDLAIYSRNPHELCREAFAEFKAHNCRSDSIEKDIRRLTQYGGTSNWFHVLGNADRGTIPAVFHKLVNAFPTSSNEKSLEMLVSFCLVKQRTAILRLFNTSSGIPSRTTAQKFFDPKSLLGKKFEEQIKVLEKSGWQIAKG